MRKTLALMLALALSTPAYASTAYLGTDINPGDTYDFLAYDLDDNIYRLVMRMSTGNTPTIQFSSDSMLIDGNPFATILGNKSDIGHTHPMSDIVGLSTALAAKLDTTAAFDGAYLSLTGRPSIPATFDDLSDGTTNKSYTATEKTKLSGIATGATANSPDSFLLSRTNHTGTQAASTITGLSTVATSGAYTDLTGKPSLATVATSGSYNDLTSKPLIPSAPVQADWAESNSAALDYVKNKPVARSVSAVTHTLTSGTGATGFQISSSRDAMADYSVTVVTSATIGGNSSGTVVLEEAATNSATAGDWVEVARCTNGQSISLAVILQSVQTFACPMTAMVPAGYYTKIRSINNSGTPTYSYNSGQETLM